ncbi:hypothetical protein OPV22_024407 [Ensete ventricosum]|uniref:RING-type E3 ubiquitin transferase n=1 Tax=Ensete ventricosum TaxID=4639 RepID=A0AAV8Q9Y0_ENSVE|nr:hypothetical protein OPV22_024407 [Ensete ventricosum]
MVGRRRDTWFLGSTAAAAAVLFGLLPPLVALRPLRERDSAAGAGSWGHERLFLRRYESDLSPYSAWNITGTYKGRWNFVETTNGSSRLFDFGNSNGESVLELVSTPTKISGVHYVQGAVTFHDVFDSMHDHGFSKLRLEGVYIWPFRQLRMVASSGGDSKALQEEDYFLSNPYHLLGVFSSQVLQESHQDKIWRRKSLNYDMEKHCNIEIAAQVSRTSSGPNVHGDHERYHLEGLLESPKVDDDGECFSPILLNATSLNTEVYYNKAINYTLMVTFVSFLQVLLLLRQMEHSNTQSGAAKVSIIMIGQQAIMDAYLCLLHLTAGILVESLFNAFATAAFFKFVVFSIFEMRYLLAIWKASRPMNNGEGWETMRRELSVLYSRFYGILLGGILLMYELHNFLRPVDKSWCIYLGLFMGLQALILLLQYFLGSRWFIPRQILPEKYCYYRKLENDTNQNADCVICMTGIDLAQQRSNDYMVTPCDHFFHTGCLQRWMDIKMECPTCRRSLPPA